MASPIPFISVVIPTYGREAVLCNTIQNVLEQTYPAFELIIVDQTSSHEPATTDFLASLAANPQVSLYTVAWASLPAARNYAVERSHGDIILFLDDDVELPQGFLAAHAHNYQTQPEVGAVAGGPPCRIENDSGYH